MMRLTVLLPGLIMVLGGTHACAQDDNSISGTVLGPNDGLVSYAPIQATHVETGEKTRAQSTREGIYEIAGVPGGRYIVKVSTPCCAYGPYESEEIEVAGATRLDIHLGEGDSFNTIGDDPGIIAAFIKERQTIPDEPVPQLQHGKPDFSGVWLVGSDPFPEEADVFPWAEELMDERIANQFRDHPHTRCLPNDPPIGGGAAPFIGKFVHKDDLLIILFEDSPGFRQVFVDGREHPEFPDPSWMGHSIGNWEGDVLVVDTVGFNDRGWMYGYPRSEELHTIERYHRTDYGRLEVEMIIEDPAVFRRPWVHKMVFDLAPQEELIEFVCENNKWAPEGY